MIRSATKSNVAIYSVDPRGLTDMGDFSIELIWTTLFKRQGMIREEVSIQGLTAITAYDGKAGWQVQPFQGRKEPERSSPDDSKGLAQRADAVPAVFTRINMHFIVTGVGLKESQVKRAVELSAEKYCSASIMLGAAGVEISHTDEIVEFTPSA